MNPILAYAVEHQAKARAILIGRYGIPIDDAEDVAQDAIVRICKARPRESTNSAAYWRMAVRSAALDYRRKRPSLLLLFDQPDRRQDPVIATLCREEFVEIWTEARLAERRAIVERLSSRRPVLSKAGNARICHLRRRMRERATA